MNGEKIPQYKKFKLFNKNDSNIDEDGRMISRHSKIYFNLEHIDIQDVKLSKETIFILGRVTKVPENQSDIDLKNQLGKPFIFKYYNQQLLDQYELFNTDTLAFDIINIFCSSYIISFGKDFSDYGLVSKLKVHEITNCIDPNKNDTKPKEIFSQVIMKNQSENGFDIILEQKSYNEIAIDDIMMIKSTEDMSGIALVSEKNVLFLLCKGGSIWKSKIEEMAIVTFKASGGAQITNVIIRNKNDFSNEMNKRIAFYYTSTDGVFYGHVNSESCYIDVNQVKNVSGIQKNCMILNPHNTDELIVASIITKTVMFIKSGVISQKWLFEGVVTYLYTHNEYLCLCLTFDGSYFLGIFDMKVNIFQYYEETQYEIRSMLSDSKKFWYLIEGNKDQPCEIHELKEKDHKEKFDIFYKKQFYDSAIAYAQSIGYSKKQIFEIRMLYAEHLYKKGDYEQAIIQYIAMINFLEPSTVIQKYFEDDKLDYLITYLEALRLDSTFMSKINENEQKEYTALLISCYIKQKKITKLEDFVQGTNTEEQDQIMETAMEVCKEHQEIETAEIIAEKINKINENDKIDYIIQIMLEFKNEFKNALETIEKEKKVKTIGLLIKFGAKFLEKVKERTTQLAYNLIRDLIDKEELTKEINNDQETYALLLPCLTNKDNEEITRKVQNDNDYEVRTDVFLSLQTPIEGGKGDENKGRTMIQKKYPSLKNALTHLKDEGEHTLELDIVCSPTLFPALNKYPEVIDYIKEYPKSLIELKGYEGKEETLVRFVKDNPFLIKFFAYFKGIGSLIMQKKQIIPIIKNNWELVPIIRIHPNITDYIIQSPGIANLVCKYPELGKMINFYPEIAPILEKTPKIAKLVKDNPTLVKYLIRDPQLVEIVKRYPSMKTLTEEPTIFDILQNRLDLSDMKCAVKLEYAKKIREDIEIRGFRPDNILSIFATQERSMDIRKMMKTIICDYEDPELSNKYKYIELLLDRYNDLLDGKDKSTEFDDTTKESITSTLFNFIDEKNPLSKDIDKSYLMMLFQTHQFKEGIVKLSDQGELNNELLTLYMELAERDPTNKENYDKIVEICKKADTSKKRIKSKQNENDEQQIEEDSNENKEENTDDNPNTKKSVDNIELSSKTYWLQTLFFFINNSNNLFQTSNGVDNFHQVLSAMDTKKYLCPGYLLTLVKRNNYNYINKIDQEQEIDQPINNNKIPYKAVKEYFINYIKTRKASQTNDKKDAETNINILEEKQKEINSFKQKGKETSLSKCPLCKKQIAFPYIYFLCGHGFHKNCYQQETKGQETEEIETESLTCLVCKKGKEDLENKIAKCNKKDSIHYRELKKDLKDPNNEDKIELFSTYLGKGVFNEESWKVKAPTYS